MTISQKATEFAGLPVIDYSPTVGIVLPTMTRREFRADGKVWAIALEGERLTTESGKGKPKAKAFPTAEAAQQEYRTQIAAKINEGYTEQQVKGETLRDALRAAIRADPNDAASRNAFADFLTEQNEQLPAFAYRVGQVDYDDPFEPHLESLLTDPAVGLLRALVIGNWGESDDSTAPIVQALIAARERLPNLRAIFLGDVPYHECEISWLVQSDLSGIFAAFPKLEHFRSRGGNDLSLKKFKHARLKSLALEASNLSHEVVKTIGKCELPALEHLELWLGTDRYGADTAVADLKGIFQAKHLPSLRYLGLRNSEIADEIAAALAKAPVLNQLKVLDLSLGTLSDEGAQALLANPRIAKLEKLDIHHHYVSEAVVAQLQGLGIEVDTSDPENPDEDHRYVAHAE